MITVDALQTPLTRAEALAWLLEYLTAEGFDSTSWQDGDIEKTLLTLQATMLADLSEVAQLHANWAFNGTATGEALRLFSQSRYDQVPLVARQTLGVCTLTSTALSPYTVQPGSLIATTAAGVEFEFAGSDTTLGVSVVVPAGGNVDGQFIARVAGVGGNVATNAINALVTPLAGVTIDNPGSPWYTVSGRDLESDAAMRRRNATRWATQTAEQVALTYESIARDAGAGKTYVDDANPRGAGTINVMASGETAVLSDPEATAIQVAFAARAFQTSATWPAPSTSRVAVVHPSTADLDVIATVYHDATITAAVMQTRLRDGLINFLRETPVGGWRYLPSNDHVVLVDDVANVLRRVAGVRTIVMTTPSATLAVGVDELVVEGTWTLTPVAQQ